jgi:hypothetical protein
MLTFYWQAYFKNDESRLKQFSPSGLESSFSLVQKGDKLKNLKRFELICVEDKLAHLAVDLETGNFEIRGAIFHPYIALNRHNEHLHYRIIFYRRMQRHLGANMQSIGDAFIHRYLIGWQCTYLGLNYQRIIFYDPTSGGIEIQAKR